MTNRYSSLADLTAKQNIPGGGMADKRRLAMCGHKSDQVGAYFRGNLMLLCAECNSKKSRK